MNGIDLLVVEHAALRAEFARLAATFAGPHGVGWDDRLSLDRSRLLTDVRAFTDAFKRHEASETALLAPLLPLAELDGPAREAFESGHRLLEGMTGLLGAVAHSCDGDHVHSVRTVLDRLGQALEEHLAFEEAVLFPALRARVPPALLRV